MRATTAIVIGIQPGRKGLRIQSCWELGSTGGTIIAVYIIIHLNDNSIGSCRRGAAERGSVHPGETELATTKLIIIRGGAVVEGTTHQGRAGDGV